MKRRQTKSLGVRRMEVDKKEKVWMSLKVLAQQMQAEIIGKGRERKWDPSSCCARNPWCTHTLTTVCSSSYPVSKKMR